VSRWTNKRRLFLEHYFACNMNATEAARRAEYKKPNRQGPKLVKVGIIADAIKDRLAAMAMDSNEVLARLGKHARITMDDFVKVVQLDDLGRSVVFVSLQQAKERGVLDCVKKITQLKDGGFTIELHDAQAALIHLDKHHGGPGKGPIPHGVDVTTKGESLNDGARIQSEQQARSMAALSDALGAILVRQGQKRRDAMDAAELTTVVGGAEPG